METYVNRTNVILVIVSLICFVFAASCTAADAAATAGAVAAVGTSAAALLDVVAPLMSPEQFAEFRQAVEGIDGTVEATKSVLTSIVDAFSAFRDAVQAKHEVIAATMQQQQVELAGKTGTGEVIGYSLGGGSAGTVASRILSAFKHGANPKAKAA